MRVPGLRVARVAACLRAPREETAEPSLVETRRPPDQDLREEGGPEELVHEEAGEAFVAMEEVVEVGKVSVR